MAHETNQAATLREENMRLKAQVAQLEDRVDHLAERARGTRAQDDRVRNLAELDQLHRTTLQSMSDVVLITDDAGQLTYVSPNVHLVFGHAREEVEREGRITFLLPLGLFDHDALETRGKVANRECRIRDSVGRARDLLVSVRKVNLPQGSIFYVCRDITERKKLEAELELLRLSLDRKVEERTQELRKSREKYRQLVEGLQDEYLFYATDLEGRISYVSPSVHNILGYGPETSIGRNWRDFVDRDSDEYSYLEELERLRLSGVTTPPYEVTTRHADGSERILEVRDHPIRDDSGYVIGSEGICKDITARKHAERELEKAHEYMEHQVTERTREAQSMYRRMRESEERYRVVVEDSPDFIVRWKGDGERTFVNDAYCQYLGQERSELIGTSFMPSIVDEDRVRLQEQLKSLTADSPVFVTQQRFTLPDGQVVWHRWSNRALFSSRGELLEFQSVGSDITAQRAAQERARDKAVADAQLRNLTARERDVMQLVVAGDANKVIARKLELSIKTIEKHRSSLMRKLAVRSVPELVRLAMLAESDLSQ